jgi:4-hydroxy 2-oxovalerate aldolase
MSIAANENIKVVDCTIRDGGLINKWKFSDEMVSVVFSAIAASGTDFFEIGYRASEKLFDSKEFGSWRFSRDDVLRKVIAKKPDSIKLGVMVDIGRVETDDFLPKDESVVDFVRVAAYLKDVRKAVELANLVRGRGYESFINIMAISTVNSYDLSEGLKEIEAETDATAVTIVDSYGSLYPDDVKHLVDIFCKSLKTKKIGFHGHNNQQLAFANTIEAVQCGATFCDATANGIGRGAGNCPIELLLAWLKNPRYNIEPVLKVIQDVFVDLREEIEWGYLIPYMITGMLNEHPRTAIALRSSDKKDRDADF